VIWEEMKKVKLVQSLQVMKVMMNDIANLIYRKK